MLTSIDICNKAKAVAAEKTLYVKGGMGNKLSQKNKLRFSNNDIYNIKRTNLIFAADEDTKAYDEFGLLSAVSGYNCRTMGEVMCLCEDISKDFTSILPGEVVFMKDRIGIFVGDGKVVTVNPFGVGETIVDGWVSHGKLPEVQYTDLVPEAPVQEVVEDGEGKVDGDVEEPSEDETGEAEVNTEEKASKVEVRPSSFRRRH